MCDVVGSEGGGEEVALKPTEEALFATNNVAVRRVWIRQGGGGSFFLRGGMVMRMVFGTGYWNRMTAIVLLGGDG